MKQTCLKPLLLGSMVFVVGLVGCASKSPVTANPIVAAAPTPSVSPITAATLFAELPSMLEAKADKKTDVISMKKDWSLLVSPDNSKFLGDKDFAAWCTVQGGKPDPKSVEQARAVLKSVHEEGYVWTISTCRTGEESYVYAKANWFRTYRQAWIGPAALTKAQELIVIQQQEEEKKRKEQIAKARELEEKRLSFIKKAKRGTTLACDGYVLDQGMSAPISQAKLSCDSIEARMSELSEQGWVIERQSQRPDGDFGGAQRTRYDFVFRKQ